jgi:3-isopropylmalate dehydratase small subunit
MGRVFKLGDGVSTDAIIPGRYNVTTDLAALGKACLIEARPDFATSVQAGDIIVAGRNFGCGSSREHAPLAIKAAGVKAVVASSFARIFYRNAVNVGLPIIQCEAVYDAVAEGDPIDVDTKSGTIESGGRRFQGEQPSAVALTIMQAGSLVDLIKTSGWRAIEESERQSGRSLRAMPEDGSSAGDAPDSLAGERTSIARVPGGLSEVVEFREPHQGERNSAPRKAAIRTEPTSSRPQEG